MLKVARNCHFHSLTIEYPPPQLGKLKVFIQESIKLAQLVYALGYFYLSKSDYSYPVIDVFNETSGDQLHAKKNSFSQNEFSISI